MRYLFLIFLSLLGYIANAQTLKEIIPGKWKLIALVNKNASAVELSKRYHFTATDSLYYSSSKVQVAMKYEVDEVAKKIKLIRAGFADSYLSVKIISPNKIEIKDLKLTESAAGILEKHVE